MISDGKPMRLSAEQHFEHLSELLLGMQVTDGQGEGLSLDEGAAQAVDLIMSAHSAGNKVMVIGNGGSAAIASHAHNDLCKAAGVRTLVFNEPPLLTALANDSGYGSVFEWPVEVWAEQSDVLLAISSSGHSESILRPVQAALKLGCWVITLSGFAMDNPLRGMGHINFYVASSEYGEVEAAHSVVMHFLTDFASALSLDERQ